MRIRFLAAGAFKIRNSRRFKIFNGKLGVLDSLKLSGEHYSCAQSPSNMVLIFLPHLCYNQRLAFCGGSNQVKEIDRVASESVAKKIDEHFRRLERMRILGQLAASIAHDLKNVIGIVSFSAETLSTKFNLQGEVKEYVDVLHRNAEQAAQIVKDLLDFTKTRVPNLAPGSLNDVLAGSLKLIKTKCMKHKISLTEKLDSNLPPVLLEPFELKGAFLNLLLNSIEAMPDGGSLGVKSEAHPAAKSVAVTIQDNGIGMSEAEIQNIGEPFYTTKPEGSGLGFYITKQILEFHKAQLSLERNKNGSGITVRITFSQIEP